MNLAFSHNNKGVPLSAKVTISLWTHSVMVNFIFMFWISFKKSKLSYFFMAWKEGVTNRRTGEKLNHIKCIWIMVLISIIFICITSTAFVWLEQDFLHAYHDDVWQYRFSLFKSEWAFLSVHRYYCFTIILKQTCLILSVAFFSTLCFILKTNFEDLFHYMQSLEAQHKFQNGDIIQELHLEYERLHGVVNQLDDMFKWFLGVNIFLGAPFVCFVGHVAYFAPKPDYAIVIFFVQGIICLLTITQSGTMLYDAVSNSTIIKSQEPPFKDIMCIIVHH